MPLVPRRAIAWFLRVLILRIALGNPVSMAQDALTPPVLRHQDSASWPDESEADALIEVMTELVVSPIGTVENIEFLSNDAPEQERAMFEQAASLYAASLRFEPARRGEVAIPARIRMRVVFTPPSDAPAPSDAPTFSDAPAPGDAPISSDAPTPGGAEDNELDGEDAGAARLSDSDSAEADTVETASPPSVDEPTEFAQERNRARRPDGELETFAARAEISAPERETVSASERNIEVGALGRVPRRDAQSMLTLAPGILLSNHGGEGHAASMFLRGFDAEEGEDLEVLVEGIPLNDLSNAHGHGYVDSSFLIPELVRALRVVQGPFDPAQGDFAVAGTAEYRLGLAERGLHAAVSYGSYQDRRLSLFWGPSGEPSATFVGVSFRAGDGWGTNRGFGNAAALAQVELEVADEWTMRVLAFGSTANWRQPGPIRLDDYRARELPCAHDESSQFFCSYDTTQGGASDRLGGGVTLDWRAGSTQARVLIHGGAHALRVRENFTGFTSDPRTDGGPQRGDALDQRYDAVTLGARADLEHRFMLLARVQHIHVGLVARHDDADTVQDRVRAELDIPYRTDFDRSVRVTSLAAFARLDADFIEWLSLSGGLRFDTFGFGVLDKNRPDEDRIGERIPREATSAFGYLAQPRGTLRVRILPMLEMADLDWLTSAGLGARSSDAAALSEAEFAPFAEVISVETGFAFRVGNPNCLKTGLHLEGGTSVFATRVTNDLVFDATRGRNTPTGPSSRVGWLAFTRLHWDDWLDASVSVTWTRGHLPPPGADELDFFAGPRLPFIPEWLTRLDMAASHALRIEGEPFEGSLALGAVLVGERPLPFQQFAEPYFVLDAALSVRWRWLEAGVVVENLLDARYRQVELNYVSNFEPDRAPSLMPARHFVAGPPLRAMGRLAVHFDIGGPS